MIEILIVDGYNAIHSIPELENELDKSLMSARAALTCLLLDYQQKSRSIKEIYVVYDSKTDLTSHMENIGIVKNIYTARSSNADQEIVSIIKNSNKPAKIAVLSRDNFVINHARAMGANVMPLSDFSKKIAMAKTYKGKSPLSDSEKDEITRELKKFWGIK
jgi:predicted RNA-binding protein with PIN domain